LLACQQFLHRRLRPFDSVERLCESALDHSLSKPFYRSRPTRKRLGDMCVGPIRTSDVGFSENLGTPNFLTSPLQLLDNALKLISLLIRQSHYVQLPHGTPPCATQHRRFVRIYQADILAVTEH
jgi:hypothetical protein